MAHGFATRSVSKASIYTTHQCILKRRCSEFAANKLRSADEMLVHNNARQKKKLRHNSVYHSLTPVAGFKVNEDIQEQIRQLRSGEKILYLMRKHRSKIEHSSVYGKAMKKCNELRAYESTFCLYTQLLRSKLPLDVVPFTIFANGMAAADKPQKLKKYFKHALQTHHLQPNIVTIATLIKSCRSQRLFKLALKYWKLLEIYRVAPNEIAFTEIITVCGRTSDPAAMKHAVRKFDEYQQKVHDKKLNAHYAAYAAYLGIFVHNADVDGMHRALNLIRQRFALNEVIYGDLMNGYFKAKQFEQALDVFDEMSMNGAVKPNTTHLFFKVVCLYQIIHRDKDILSMPEKLELYQRVQSVINEELPFYGFDAFEVKAKFAVAYLSATIVTFYDTNPMEIVKVFQELCDQKLIGYYLQNGDNKPTVIDLHCFHFWESQFIMRYILAFEIDNIVWHNQQIGYNSLCIITGSGKHNKGNNKQELQQFLIADLLKYNPPIKAVINAKNPGKISIDHTELKPYVDVPNNDALRQLRKETCNAHDWFLHVDPFNMGM